MVIVCVKMGESMCLLLCLCKNNLFNLLYINLLFLLKNIIMLFEKHHCI